ncbi:MAG: UDP-N-acetylglucosamine--N-acetylmuramyl-(pentapeptide) pyrophosphoryl-undecaprenol N-acetylglucosamine transferase [Fimbriimonadaceae bacterium]|nr:UDP-N-acetylglucosamine--N-acetylmuramyl-(pentapeptide) pyrophosphoryl-undecaprenol N-acetylglucosamine transferase [Fimbriimonadaceae bacterium]
MAEAPRILLAGGGTGGHIYPLVSLAHAWLAAGPGRAVRFVGERSRMEADLVPREGFDLTLLDLPPANAPAWRKALLAGRWLRGWRQTQRLLDEFRPDLVVGAGGQVCAPVLLAAKRRGLPRAILEPNAVPGRANLWLARWARPELVAVLMPAARPYFGGLRVEELGYPIRPAILAADRATSAAALGLDPARPTLLVFGGSLGSQKINEALVGLLPSLREPWAAGWQVLHLGGRVNARALPAAVAAELSVGYQYRDYLHEMEQALAVADLVVSRAGAMSLAELAARGIPAILSPFPGAADDHQRGNAAWMVDAGAATLVDDAELTPERLRQELAAVLGEPGRLAQMAARSRALGRPQAAAALASALQGLLPARCGTA